MNLGQNRVRAAIASAPAVLFLAASAVLPRATITDVSVDTEQAVVAPDGSPINGYGGMTTLADEHSTIFSPGTLAGHLGGDYLFFVATRTLANPTSSGVVVLSSRGPRWTGQWTLDFAPDFGLYSPGAPPGYRNAQIFQSPVYHDDCPPTGGHPAAQDRTFDLNYADPGSVLVDPTNPFNTGPGRVFMIYEGTTRCIGIAGGGNGTNNFYSTIGVATSNDGGHTWPTYLADAVQLPLQSMSAANAAMGATGALVCEGSNCSPAPPLDPNYGRYAAIGAPSTVDFLMNLLGSTNLPSNGGNSQPSAFVDDVHWLSNWLTQTAP